MNETSKQRRSFKKNGKYEKEAATISGAHNEEVRLGELNLQMPYRGRTCYGLK